MDVRRETLTRPMSWWLSRYSHGRLHDAPRVFNEAAVRRVLAGFTVTNVVVENLHGGELRLIHVGGADELTAVLTFLMNEFKIAGVTVDSGAINRLLTSTVTAHRLTGADVDEFVRTLWPGALQDTSVWI